MTKDAYKGKVLAKYSRTIKLVDRSEWDAQFRFRIYQICLDVKKKSLKTRNGRKSIEEIMAEMAAMMRTRDRCHIGTNKMTKPMMKMMSVEDKLEKDQNKKNKKDKNSSGKKDKKKKKKNKN